MILRKQVFVYSTTLFVTALVSFIIIIWTQPTGLPEFWAEILLSTSIVIWLAHHYLRFEHFQTTLIHAITLSLGLSIGILPVLISLSVGIFIYAGIDLYRNRRHFSTGILRNQILAQWSGIWGRQVLANSLGLSLYSWLGGSLTSGLSKLPEFWPFLGCVTGFSLSYLTLHWFNPGKQFNQKLSRRETVILITVTLAPAPVILLAATAFGFLGTASFIIYSILLAVSAPIFNSLTQMENALRQRAEALGLLSGLAASITSTYDPDQVMELIIDSAIMIGSGEQALIHVYTNSNGDLEKIHSHNLSDKARTAWLAGFPDLQANPDLIPEGDLMLDQLRDQELPGELRTILRNEGIVSLASLALHTSKARLGRLTIFSSDPVVYSPRRRELLTLFSAQAAFALSNAQAHASADQSLSLQTEQLSRLEEINRQLTASSASDNLHEVILDHAIQATAADGGYLAIYHPESGSLHLDAYQRTDDEIEPLDAEPRFSIEEGLIGRAFRTGQVLNVQTSSTDPEYVDLLGTMPKSMLCVPVCGPEAMLGVIGVESSRAQAFSAAQEQFLIQLSAYAANALYHARIYNQLQERLTEQSLLYQASTQIAESLESNAVGMAIADSLRFAVHSDVASVYRWNEEDQSLVLLARIEDGKPSKKTDQVPDTHLLLGHAQCIKERVCMQWSSLEEVSVREHDYMLEQYGEGRLLLLPLCIGERTLGLVEIFRANLAPFSQEAIRSAQSIAIQATIALENTDLFQRISESHTRLLAVLNSTREGMLLIDTEGIIAIVNSQIEAMIGLGSDVLLRNSLDDSSLGLASRLGYNQADLAQLASSLKKGQAQLAGSARFKSIEGTGKSYHRIDAPVYDSNGQLIGWLISVRDVSAQREIEETREQLTEMIVHDLRSPLTAILNSLSLLRRDLGEQTTSSITEQALAVSDRSVNQMLGLVNSLLDISRLESGKLKISSEEVLIQPFMEELQERFQLEANTIGIILKSEYGSPKVSANFDREKIQRVLANLLDNALKFTPVGGEIELGFTQNKNEIIFWVSDTGPGIPIDFHQKIFERYIQIPGTTGRRRGTGLGLAFAKLAVEAHQGRLWVEEHPSGGSIFKFSLPK